MTPSEITILIRLRLNPTMCHVTADGKALYALSNGQLVRFTGPDFNKMDADQINKYIQHSLTSSSN